MLLTRLWARAVRSLSGRTIRTVEWLIKVSAADGDTVFFDPRDFNWTQTVERR